MPTLAYLAFTPCGDGDDFENVVNVLRVGNAGIVAHPIRQPAVLLNVSSR